MGSEVLKILHTQTVLLRVSIARPAFLSLNSIYLVL